MVAVVALYTTCFKGFDVLGAKFASLEYHAANTRANLFYQERMGYRMASVTVIKRLDR